MSIEMIDSVLRKMDCDLELHHRTWEIDGDLYRCRHCNSGQLASKGGEKFVHASDCEVPGTASDHPWLDLVRLTSVLATPPAQVQTRYCDTCERDVPDPCSSRDCSTPEKEQWEQPVNQHSGSAEWSEALLRKLYVRLIAAGTAPSGLRIWMQARSCVMPSTSSRRCERASQHQGQPANLALTSMLNLNWSAGEVVQAITDQGPLFRKPPVSHGDTAALRQVYDLISLSYSQPVSVLLVNFKNIIRFANLLHAIEREFLMVPGEPSDEPEDEGCEPEDVCLVNCWGSSKEQYIEQFRAALASLTDKRNADLAKYIDVVEGCYRLTSVHSGSIDGVDELGGDEHEDPICAIFHRLYYARFLVRKSATDGATS
jgi:hypothetical protein